MITHEELLAIPPAERPNKMRQLSKSDLQASLGQIPNAVLLALGRDAVALLGTYKTQLTKQERVGGKMVEAQTIDLTLQPDPFAVLLAFVNGPGKGRRVLFNRSLRQRELRVKEGGVLRFAPGLWLDIENPLVRKETNHPITHIGLGVLLDLIEEDMDRAGGLEFERSDEPINDRGVLRVQFLTPKDATDVRSTKTLIDIDAIYCRPSRIEVHDREGLLEIYSYTEPEKLSLSPDHFTPKKLKL